MHATGWKLFSGPIFPTTPFPSAAAEAALEAERAAHLAVAASRDQAVAVHEEQLSEALAVQERVTSQRIAQLEAQLKDIRSAAAGWLG